MFSLFFVILCTYYLHVTYYKPIMVLLADCVVGYLGLLVGLMNKLDLQMHSQNGTHS